MTAGPRRWRPALIAAGAVIMAAAVIGALTDRDVKPLRVLIFLGVVLIGHDAILLPAVIGTGALIGRYVPAPHRTAVRAAALVSLAVTVIATPLVGGYGHAADNPSVLPRPYGYGLAAVLGLVWAATLATIALRSIRPTRPTRPTRPSRPSQGGRKVPERSSPHQDRPPGG